MNIQVGIIVGSLRRESFSRKIGNNAKRMFPEGYTVSFVDLSQVEMYNADLDDEGRPTDAWIQLRKTLSALDAVLFITPEYNRSLPAVLKNALDVGSRPAGQSVWNGKPAAIISVSPGNLSAFGANHHLRQSLVFLNMPAMQQPEAYMGGVASVLDEAGQINNERTENYLQKAVDGFVRWIEKVKE